MAAQFGEASDRVSRTGALPSPATGLTIVGWARVDTDTNTFAVLARVWTAVLGTVITFGTSGDGLGGPNYFTGGGSVSSSTNFVVGEWRRVAVTCLGTTGEVYAATPLGAVEVDSGAVSTNTPGGITLGGRDTSDASENLVGTLAYWRVFPTKLNQAQIEAEWASPTAVAAAWADWPLVTDLNDISGNARHLSAGSTSVAWVAGPDLPSTPETATLAGTLPRATLAADAVATAGATLAAGLPRATALMTSTASAGAVLGGALSKATASLAAEEPGAAPSPSGASYWGPEAIVYSTNGDSARKVPMEVREVGSGNLATLYADPDRVTVLANPVKTDQYGNLAFYIDAGTYNVQMVGSSFSFRIVVPATGSSGGGGGEGGSTYEFVQVTPQSVWTVTHNLGRRPAGVSVFSMDYATEYDDFAVQHVSANQLLISMDLPTAGRALM